MIHDISGKWKFTEEFECGMDKGFAIFVQDKDLITGYIEYDEVIEDEKPFRVKQEILGAINGNHIELKGTNALSPDGLSIDDYNLDTMEGTLTQEGKIVGHSFDSKDICGVFVLERE